MDVFFSWRLKQDKVVSAVRPKDHEEFKPPAYQVRCSGAVAGAADHALLSGYNDKAKLGTHMHPLLS